MVRGSFDAKQEKDGDNSEIWKDLRRNTIAHQQGQLSNYGILVQDSLHKSLSLSNKLGVQNLTWRHMECCTVVDMVEDMAEVMEDMEDMVVMEDLVVVMEDMVVVVLPGRKYQK